VVDLNDALSDVWTRIKVARGVLEFDDFNYADLPVATFPITSAASRYKITEDDDSNQVITIHKVQITKDGELIDIPRLKVGEPDQDALGTLQSGFPTGYYEIGATIAFNATPDDTYTAQVWFDRSPDFFAVGGTTFVPGIPNIYHSTLGEKAALKYAVIKNLKQAPNLLRLVELGESRIDDYESNRRDDEQGVLVPAVSDPT
jgi:hypothetical protein